MAEEGTLGQARVSLEGADDGEEPSKEELQRRMEEARETITQTVTEIKETVTNQYYTMKETVTDALDWRHHFRKNPIAFSVGALSVGFLLGYGLVGTVKGRGSDRREEDYPSYDETDVYARTGATPPRYEDESVAADRHSAFHGHSFAAQPITDSPRETVDSERSSSYAAEEAGAADYRPSQGGSYSYAAPSEEGVEEAQKPGLLERFKETSAYDRLQTEVASLGDRFMEELSTTARTVVLPALFNKLKGLFGVDLSDKQSQSQQPQQANRTTDARAQGSAGGARAASASASGGSSYGTSENRGYGAQPDASDAGRGGEGSSVLDLDR